MIRRDPNRPPPAWPPNPPTPPRRPPPPAATATDLPARRLLLCANAPPPPPRPRRASPSAACVAIVLALFALLVLAVAGLVGTAFWIDTKLHRIPALADYPDRPAEGKGTTWLLVGSDSRQGLTPEQQAELGTGGDIGNGHTDTIMLVHMPAPWSDTPTTMVSIPRDSYVEIPDYGTDKINASFAVGGAALLAQTVEQATGMRLDHYAEVEFDGFARLVDAVGGVTMCPPEPISDPLAGIDLPAGCQKTGRPQRARITCAPAPHRGPTSTGWSTSVSSCRP